MEYLNSKAITLSARRLEAVQQLLGSVEGLKRQITDCFADGLIDKAACQQARQGIYLSETGLRAFALAEEKEYVRVGGGFYSRKVGPSGMLHGK